MTATTTQATLRAGLYGRESKGKDTSIEDQIALGQEAIASRPEWHLAETYSDGSSASQYARKRRADWERLLADLDAGRLEILVFWEASRGTRVAKEWLAMLDICADKGVLIHVVSSDRTYNPGQEPDWEALAEDGLRSQSESGRMAVRIRRRTARTAELGGVHGRTPLGYERLYNGRKFVEQRFSDAAPVVQRIFRDVGRGVPIAEIVRTLDAEAVPTMNGEPWNRATVTGIVRNVAYLGLRRHRVRRKSPVTGNVRLVSDETHKAVWPALVDQAVWDRANAVLDAPGRRTTKPGKARWLLSYVAAAPCGGLLHALASRQGRTPRYQCHADQCVSIDQPSADEVVSRLMVGAFTDPAVRHLFDVDDSGVSAALAELGRLQRRLDEAQASFVSPEGGISASMMAALERNLTPRIADAKRRARPETVPAGAVELMEAAEFGAERVRPVWDVMPTAVKRAVIGMVLTVVIGPATGRVVRGMSAEDRVALAWARFGGTRWVGSEQSFADLGVLDIEV